MTRDQSILATEEKQIKIKTLVKLKVMLSIWIHPAQKIMLT
jgi:hypothetical protein